MSDQPNPLLSVPEARLFASSPEVRRALLALVDADALGIHIAAPSRVDLRVYQGIPIVGCNVATLREVASCPSFVDAAIVVASDLRTGVVRADLVTPRTNFVIGAFPDDADPGPGISGTSFQTDAAERLAIPSRSASLVVRVIVRDRASNAVRVDVEGGASRWTDPEVVRFVDDWRASHAPLPRPEPPPVPGAKLPAYGAGANAPRVPGQVGIALDVPRVFLLEPGAPCVLAGSFRVKALRQQIIGAPSGAEQTTAIVPITLVVTGGDEAGPIVIPLQVPSATPIDPSDPAPIVEGKFAVDLLAFPQMWRGARTSFVWAFSGETVSEPATTAFVTKDMLEDASDDD